MGENQRSKYLGSVVGSPWEFLMVFLAVFFLLSVFLFVIDFVPEPVTVADTQKTVAEETTPVVQQFPIEVPVRIAIESIGVDTQIVNPVESDIATLDASLLKGAVRYPESALLGENASMFLFGHQSYLPVVRNQAFKAFNDLQKLNEGDEISVFSETAEYRYRVTSVTLVHADTSLVELNPHERTLTLTTCNSFGEKSERYVVEAEFVSRIVIES